MVVNYSLKEKLTDAFECDTIVEHIFAGDTEEFLDRLWPLLTEEEKEILERELEETK